MTQETATVTTQVVMGPSFWIATGIFLIAYAVIVSEKIHKTIVAIFGAGLMLVLKILQQHEAFHVEEFGVDWNVIFLLISMMVIINLMRPTGVFEYIAIKSAKWGKGEPFRIMVIFAIVTAVLSALLDNVTTVLLIVPVTILIADRITGGCPSVSDLLRAGLKHRRDCNPDRRSPQYHDRFKGTTEFYGLYLSPCTYRYRNDGLLHLCHKTHLGQEDENER